MGAKRFNSLWYTGGVLTTLQQLSRRLATRAPYPFALQSLISLVVLTALPSAFAEAGSTLSPRFALLCGLIEIHLAICWFVPVRRLRFWLQFASLALQVGAASLAHVLMPSPLLGYVYLVIVLQAVYLFRPLLWILFAGWVYIIWSGSLMIASASLLDRRLERLVVDRPRAHVSDAPHSDGASLVGSLRRQFIVGTRETARPG